MEQPATTSALADNDEYVESMLDQQGEVTPATGQSPSPASMAPAPRPAPERDIPLHNLYRELQKYQNEPRFYYRINEVVGNVEYLIGDDLAPWLSASGPLEERARRFLKDEAQLFGLDARWIDQTIFLKHRLHSYLGNHYIFGLRALGTASLDETLNASLVFHFDTLERLVMVAGTYHPLVGTKRLAMDNDAYQGELRPPSLAIGAGAPRQPASVVSSVEVAKAFSPLPAASGQNEPVWDNAKVEEKLLAIAQDRLLVTDRGKAIPNPEPKPQQIAFFRPERKSIFNPAKKQHEACVQVKYTTERNDSVFIINGQGDIVECFHVDARAPIHIAYVYRQFWQSEEPTMELENLQKVALRDLTSDIELIGRYVDVRDVIGYTKPVVWQDLLNAPESTFDTKTSLADRVLVYYHIDRVQRYFRELGLTVLDQYPALNPIRVELGAGETKFQPNGQRILFKHLRPNSTFFCTEARSAHIVYHEFVHAVTDALARLRRDSDSSAEREKVWRIQVRQAHGLDEGYADYFACSLATRQGATFTTIGELKVDDHGKIMVDESKRHDLGKIGADFDAGEAPSLARMVEELKMNADQESRWPDDHLLGRAWAAFLWLCREKMTPDIADIVIAHSIFFLTRWSTFGTGVMALVLADRLLFNGLHERVILAEVGGQAAKDWTTIQEMAPQ